MKGQFHNPEFTMLEWYRLGFNHHDLMNEMDELLQLVLQSKSAERKSYAEIFQSHLQIDAHQANLAELSVAQKIIFTLMLRSQTVIRGCNYSCRIALNRSLAALRRVLFTTFLRHKRPSRKFNRVIRRLPRVLRCM